MKTCTKCGISKDESEFHKDSKNPDGLRSRCKICISIKNKEFYYSLSEEEKKKRCINSCIYQYKIRIRNGSNPQKKIENVGITKHKTDHVNYEVCKIILKHHEDMKDDPEHLSTEFIQKLIKVKCNEHT